MFDKLIFLLHIKVRWPNTIIGHSSYFCCCVDIPGHQRIQYVYWNHYISDDIKSTEKKPLFCAK